MANSLVRFQEHYESPEWRGKIFTLGQFYEWYSEFKGGYTYADDWSGFNFPDYVLKPFINGLFDPLTKVEKKIVKLFRYRTDKFYVIGSANDSDKEVFPHELAHAIYYTNDKYREKVNSHLQQYNLHSLKNWLKSKGYCEEVLDDECNAYLACDTNLLDEEGVEYPEQLQSVLEKLFNKTS